MACLHAKVILIDSKWFSVGSQNLTRRGRSKNLEASFVSGQDASSADAAAFFKRIHGHARRITLTEIVAMENCRYDAAVEVDDVRPEGRIGRFEFPAMRVAEVRIVGDIALEVRALDWLYGTWLPRSGYEPDDQPVFEAWLGRPFAHGVEHFTIACQLPVRRSRG